MMTLADLPAYLPFLTIAVLSAAAGIALLLWMRHEDARGDR